MQTRDLSAMSLEELWALHEQIAAQLARKISEEKIKLEARLRQLQSVVALDQSDRPRRAYPKVRPKYINPENPAETWAGRGKQPGWIKAQLRSGKKLNDFLVERSPTRDPA